MGFFTEDQVYKTLLSIGVDMHSETADDFIVFCPYHNNRHTPAGEVSKERGTFYCFSCRQTASLEDLVMHVTGRTYFEAVRLIGGKKSDADITNELEVALKKREEVVEFDQDLVDRLHTQMMHTPRALHYLELRDIKCGVEKFQLGYSETRDMVIVPVHHHNGMLIGFVARSIEGKEFKNSTGLKKSKVLFNLNRVKTKPTVVVVESSFDAIKLDCFDIPAVATLGAGVSKVQLELLDKFFNTVVVVPDNDEAGQSMVEKLTSVLSKKLIVVPPPAWAKDVGDLSGDHYKKLAALIDDPLAALV